MEKLDVILPAGGRIDEAFAAEAGTPIKALVKVGGKSVLERTIEAVRGTGRVDRIVVIGPEPCREEGRRLGAEHTLEEGSTGPDNIFRGLECLLKEDRKPTRLLVVTTDLPFLSSQIFLDYLALCPPEKEFTVPLIAKETYRSTFPGSDATYVRLRDGAWTTGCAYVMSVDALLTARPHIERVFENRKSKLGMARLLGPAFICKWLARRLTVPDVENKVVNLLGVNGAAVPDSPPELAFDIDYLEDYRYALSRTDLVGPRV